MISDRALDVAVSREIVTADTVERLRALQAELAPDNALPGETAEAPDDEESLRFITGFADIFVTVGIVLFLGALIVIMNARAGSTPMYAGVAACAWLLAEFFTFKRRMALPSIVLLLVFVVAVFMLSVEIAASLLHATAAGPAIWTTRVPTDLLSIGIGAVVAAGAAALHFAHFRVPITVAAGTAALCVLVVAAAVGTIPGLRDTGLDAVLLICGLAVFALAMRFDMSDPARRTRRTDIAFWLHLLAAPLIVHALMGGLLHGLDTQMTLATALGILWLFVLLGLVAVIVDRRALLVSGLVYAGIANAMVIRASGLTDRGLVVPTVVLVLGAFILLLSAGWQPLRRAILRRLPHALATRLPHPLLATHS